MIRFTETAKWDDPWFRTLSGAHKLVFIYLTDKCNNAGFYEVDIDAMQFQLNIARNHIEAAFKALDKGVKQTDGWIWIRRFIHHQKNGALNESNNAHKQIISLIKEQYVRFAKVPEFMEFIKLYKGKFSPIIGATKPHRYSKGIVKVREEEAHEIYEIYPKKVGRPRAIAAILRALDKTSFEILREKTIQYAAARAGKPDFTPHPASWFNAERYNDDPSTWGSAEPKLLKPSGPPSRDTTNDIPAS
jgi:hypothetical protein